MLRKGHVTEAQLKKQLALVEQFRLRGNVHVSYVAGGGSMKINNDG
jgi:hypothetical protein